MNSVVILPTYNERDNIISLLKSLDHESGKIHNHTISYLVVDDDSPDGTGALILEYQKKHPAVFLLTGKKEGLGKALLRGIAFAVEKLHAEIIVQMDADLSHDPGSLPKYFQQIDNGADFIVGSRYITGGSIPDNWGVHRKIFSIVGNSIVRFGLGYSSVHDWTGGYRAYHKKYYLLLRDDLIRFKGYVFQIAFLYNAILHGARVVEVPIHFTDRRFGHSKIAPSEYIRDVLAFVIVSRFKSLMRGTFVRFCVVGGTGFIINTFILELLVRFGFHPALGSALGAELAIISNFILNNTWTFKTRKISGNRQFMKFIQFNTTSLGAIFLQTASVFFGTHIFGIQSYRVFYVIGVGFGLIWNYMTYSLVIWKK